MTTSNDDDEYTPVINNESGRLDIKLSKHGGIWFFVEDQQDCCSVGLDESEIDRLIAVLTEFKSKLQGRTMAERAKLRPSNFAELSPQEQWAIDKRLGILDWDGT